MSHPVPAGRSDGTMVLPLSGGGRLGYREYGDPMGKPLIFFHGWPGSSAQGIFLQEIGCRSGVRVIAVDRPGIGHSSRIPHRTFLDIPPLIEQLAEALELGVCHLLGVSGGGPYALACAWAIPHRVRAVAVCCGAPPLDTPAARRQFSLIYQAMLSINDRFPKLMRSMLAPVTLAAKIRPPWAFMRLITGILGPRDRLALLDRARFTEFYPSFQGAMRSGRLAVYEDGHAYSLPWPFDVSDLRVPVRIWHGTQDTNFHYSLAAQLAGRIPGAAFHLREEGHYSLAFFCAEEIVRDLMACRAGE